MLEKLFGVWSFGGFIGHLTYHYATLPASSSELDLYSMVWTIIPAFLGCWALIILAFFFCFWQDDRPILLDVITHIEIDTSAFLDNTTRCVSHVTPSCSFWGPTLWKLNGLVLPPVAGFFGGLLTWIRFCFTLNKCSFGYHTNTSLLMCGSRGRCLVINLSYHTKISFIINSLSYNITYLSWLATSYSCPPFMVLVWSYHW